MSFRDMPNQRSESKVPPRQVPASHLQKHIKEPYQSSWPTGGTPWGGGTFLPHIFTVAGRYGVASKAYSVGDEALIDSRENAEMMRNELAIMECLEARMRSTALLNWHIGPRDETLDQRTKATLAKSGFGRSNKWQADELAAKVSLILARTPHLTKLFYSLMDAIWYGRYATEQFWQPTSIEGLSNRAMIIKRWEPRHGDKIIFRYDDGTQEYDPEQIGIRIGPGYKMQQEFRDYGGNLHKKVEATQFGLAYFLDGAERKKYALHKHIIEDGDFNRPIKAGNLHGVGIRSRIYWSWYAYTESLKLLMEYLERSALGIEIWRYPAHNPQAKADAAEAAQRRGAPGRSILMVPVPEGEAAAMYDVEIVEPGLQGADVLQNVLQTFFGHKIKRYILGQTLTTEADATGMGSGMADLHAATYSDIVRFDSLGLAETITQDIVRQIQLLNFPGSEGIHLQFRFDTESPMMQMKLDAYRQLWEMGAKVKTDDLFKTIGASRPNTTDETLLNPAYFEMEQMQQQQGMAPAMDLGAMQMPEGEEQAGDAEMAQDMLMPAMMDQFSAEPIINAQPRYSQPITAPQDNETVETDVMRFAAEMCEKYGNDAWQSYVDRYGQGGFDFESSEPEASSDKGFQESFGFAEEAEPNSKGEVQSGLFGNEYKAGSYTKKDKDILPEGFFEAQKSAPMTPRRTKAPLRPAPKGMFDETAIPATAQKSAKEVFTEGLPAADREALYMAGYTIDDYWKAISSGDKELIKQIAKLLPSTAPAVEAATKNLPPSDGMLFSVMNQMILRYATQGSFDFEPSDSQPQKKSHDLENVTGGNASSSPVGSENLHPHSSMVNHDGPTKLTLIPCTGGKNEGTHKAKDLYKGDNFAKHRKYAESSGNPWAIVSAEHHILDPDEMVANYDTPMPKRKADQERWGQQLKPKLLNHLKRLGVNAEHGVEIETLAGNDYNNPMRQAFLGHEQVKGITAPMQGLGQGLKKTWMVNELKLKDLESKRNDDEETLEDLAIEGYDRDIWRKLAPHIDDNALNAIHENPSYHGESIVLGGIPLDEDVDLHYGSPLYRAFREQEEMGIGIDGNELRPGSTTMTGGNYEPESLDDKGLDEYVKNHYPNLPYDEAHWDSAGYIFADGSLNDMGHGQGQRADDHRSVVATDDALKRWGFSKEQQDSRTLAMNEMMRRTNMARIHIGGGESGTDLQLHIEAPLTSAQEAALTYYVKHYRPQNVFYDIGGGFGYAEDNKSGEIDNPRSFNDVLNHMEGADNEDEDEYDLDQYSADLSSSGGADDHSWSDYGNDTYGLATNMKGVGKGEATLNFNSGNPHLHVDIFSKHDGAPKGSGKAILKNMANHAKKYNAKSMSGHFTNAKALGSLGSAFGKDNIKFNHRHDGSPANISYKQAMTEPHKYISSVALSEKPQKYSASSHDESAISTANATSRSGGAVGGHPVTIKYVRQLAKRKVPILDFGAGKAAAQAKELNKMGYNVVPYDYGKNAVDGVHDPAALDREYPFVYASNVLNVQDSIGELKKTIQEIAESVAVGGTFIGNLPASPRKAAFDGMSPADGADLVKKLLEQAIGNVRIEESPSHPVFVVSKGQRQRYSTMIADRYEARMPTRSSKMGVGKQIGNAVYVHRQYTGTTPEAERVKQAAKCAGSWAWDIAKITPESISLIKSPDFDNCDEPISGDSLVVRNNGSTRLVSQHSDPNIYHHKWLMVGDDYKGFDVEQSKQRSSQWIQLPIDKSKIGKQSYWQKHVIPLIDKCNDA